MDLSTIQSTSQNTIYSWKHISALAGIIDLFGHQPLLESWKYEISPFCTLCTTYMYTKCVSNFGLLNLNKWLDLINLHYKAVNYWRFKLWTATVWRACLCTPPTIQVTCPPHVCHHTLAYARPRTSVIIFVTCLYNIIYNIAILYSIWFLYNIWFWYNILLSYNIQFLHIMRFLYNVINLYSVLNLYKCNKLSNSREK